MKIAIVGGGLAGVATAWHLLQKKGVMIDLFESQTIASGASGIASGFLHPFVGRHGVKVWRADEGMGATHELLQVAEEMIGKRVCSEGIFRPAVTKQQREDFRKNGIWWEGEEFQRQIPHAAKVPGMWIPEGKTIFTSLYLIGLWLACEQKGGRLIQEKIDSLSGLDRYDQIVVTAGEATLSYPECAHLPLKRSPGQLLLCRWKEPLPFSLVSQGQIALTEERDFCRVGSTYEHGEVFSENVIEELKQRASLFYPPVVDFEVLEIKRGIRVSPLIGYRPFLERVKEKIWVLSGLGSRGMIYHALMAKDLAGQI